LKSVQKTTNLHFSAGSGAGGADLSSPFLDYMSKGAASAPRVIIEIGTKDNQFTLFGWLRRWWGRFVVCLWYGVIPFRFAE
jgi:hypothetical protein